MSCQRRQKEHVTTVPSKYELHSHAAHFFGSSHSHHGWMSSLYCVLNWLIIIIMHIHMHFIALWIPLILIHFFNMETAAGSNL